jgi:hypothetical protein
MNFFEVNREERHFGFLFMTAILAYPDFRKCLFELLNKRTELALDPDNFEVYAEPAIFRDYWYDLGNHKNYDKELCKKRIKMVKKLLYAMGNDLPIKNSLFWTGKVEESKIRFPGKWATNKIRAIESEKKTRLIGQKLLRCKWLCNAKPDVMIQSKKNILFIEIKVESSAGSDEEKYNNPEPTKRLVYNQKKTQNDIVDVVEKLIDGMNGAKIERIELTRNSKTLPWKEVKKRFNHCFEESENKDDLGLGLIKNHFKNMPPRDDNADS